MNVLLLSFDKKILNKETESYERMSRYAADVSMLGVIVLSNCEEEKTEHGPFIATGFMGNPVARLWKAYKTLSQWAKKYNAHIISSQEPFESGFVAWLVARKNNAKLEVQLHGDFYGNSFWRNQSKINKIRAKIGLFVLKRAQSIRVVSQRIKKSLIEKGVSEDKITVTPVAAQSTSEMTNHESHEKFTVLVVSRLTKEKNVTLLTRAMPYICGSIPGAQCLVIGDGPQKNEILASAKSIGIAESIHLHGYKRDLAHYYAHADVVVIPSHTEGWGRVAIEAMSHKKPIVMTDVGVAGEIIKHRHNGLVVPENDAGALAEAVIELYEKKEYAAQLAHQARQDFESLAQEKDAQVVMINAWKKMMV